MSHAALHQGGKSQVSTEETYQLIGSTVLCCEAQLLSILLTSLVDQVEGYIDNHGAHGELIDQPGLRYVVSHVPCN